MCEKKKKKVCIFIHPVITYGYETGARKRLQAYYYGDNLSSPLSNVIGRSVVRFISNTAVGCRAGKIILRTILQFDFIVSGNNFEMSRTTHVANPASNFRIETIGIRVKINKN